MKCKLLILSVLSITLISCGLNNNVTISYKPGQCANKSINNAPYCMSVTVTNSSGVQNWITSTNFPVTDLKVTLTEISNLQYPGVNPSMDPDGCTRKSIAPGSSCTFYFQINNESYPTTQIESITATLTYNLNNNLFGGGGVKSSHSFNFYQVTNLYTTQNNGALAVDNPLKHIQYSSESDPIIYTTAIDNSSTGYLYTGGSLGIYISGRNTITSSISPSGFNGAGNLFILGNNLYAAGNAMSPSIWTLSLANYLWSKTSFTFPGLTLAPNANTTSPTGIIYLAANNQVYSCRGSSTTNNCNPEAGSIVTGNITKLAFPKNNASPYTGLYAGTTSGLYAESGTLGSASAQWVKVIESSSSQEINSNITSMINDQGNLFVGDNLGRIWLIRSESPVIANQITSLPGKSISSLVIDNIAGVLYLGTNSLNNNAEIYFCKINPIGNCKPTLFETLGYSNLIVGMNIGSSLESSVK